MAAALSTLSGRRVVLGVAGGIAAYKAVEILRLLTKAGAEVEVVLTPEAARFVQPLTFTALSGRACRTELWDADDPIPHTRLGQWAELIVLAPTTAHLAARLANGLADDLLTNTVLASRAPVLCALAMHTEMWEQPSVRRNVARLRADGVCCIDPDVGLLAGGDVGAGRLAEPEHIVGAAADLLATRAVLAGRRILVTAGGTREPVDAVRYVGNRSTGKMGHAIAASAARHGAQVTLVTTSPLPADGVRERIQVETAAEMADAVFAAAPSMHAVVMSAAVADFRPADPAAVKLKKDAGPPAITLEPTVDILATLGSDKRAGLVLVGFAAETDDVVSYGAAKVARKNLDLLVANVVGVADSGFGTDTDRAWFCTPDGGAEALGLLDKADLADRLCERIAKLTADADVAAAD